MMVQPYARIARTMCSVTYQVPNARGLRPHCIASARSSSSDSCVTVADACPTDAPDAPGRRERHP